MQAQRCKSRGACAKVQEQRGGGAKAEGYKRIVQAETNQNNPFTGAKAYDIIEKDCLPASAMPDELWGKGLRLK